MIPEKILNLTYSKHAIRERIFEQKGTIEYVPKHFIRAGCKSVEDQGETIRATYIYDNTRDITLIININTALVITNYLKFSNNENCYKGRFHLNKTTNLCQK